MSSINAPANKEVLRIEATVLARRQAWSKAVTLRLQAPAIAHAARPGQFVMMGPLPGEGCDPFLCRPYSIHRKVGKNALDLLIGVVGRGSASLAALRRGSRIGILGPLGRGFSLPAKGGTLLAVGGGLGVAPLVFLVEEAVRRGRDACLLHGARTAEQLTSFAWLRKKGAEVLLAAEDGKAGWPGTVVELLGEVIRRKASDWKAGAKSISLAACGPREMLRAVAALALRHGLPCEVALEGRMACGVGACLGCTEILAGGRQVRLCCEGPVFTAQEVFGL